MNSTFYAYIYFILFNQMIKNSNYFSDVNLKLRTCLRVPKNQFDEEVLADLLENFNQSFVKVKIPSYHLYLNY